jgi:hypothetical protein
LEPALGEIDRSEQAMAEKETRKAASPSKITVLLDEPEFQRFDAYCHERGYKKSTLIARLIRQYLDLEGFGVARDNPFNRFGRAPVK